MGQAEMLKELTGKGVKLNMRTRRKSATVLHKAVSKPNYECVKIRIENNCNVNLQMTEV